jgi:RNA polymerase sigma factor (sigma-70 family)
MLRVPDMGAIRNPEAYLYTVASNLGKEHARQEHKDAAVLDIDDPLVQQQLSELPAFAGQLDTEQRIRRLREVLQQLPPKCRAAVVLQYWHGLSYEEIAQRLGVSTHMVKKHLSQALLHCRRRMARLG